MSRKSYIVFFDFDNTITKFDILDDLLARFSKDKRWVELEKKWKNGEIGSRECLAGQVKGLRITKRQLDLYISKVKLDPHFKTLLIFLRSKKIKTVIVSDNFDYILNRVLKINGIRNMKVYSNRLKLNKNRLMPYFPTENKDCMSCAHCKNNTLAANANRNHTKVYIGDGRSDVCPSEDADMVFAKDDLLKHYKNKGLPHIPYKKLEDVYKHLKRSIV